LGLFEATGIILMPHERIVKRGRFKGKVPRSPKTVIKGARLRYVASYESKMKIKWKKREGELILTNMRLIAVPTKLEPIANLELERLFAVTMTIENKLQLSMDYGAGKIENMVLQVDGVSEWINAIRSAHAQAASSDRAQEERKQEVEISKPVKKCPKCGVEISPEHKYCVACGAKLEPA